MADIRDYKGADPEQQLAMREELIRQYLPLIKLVANRILRKLPPQIEIGDLINTGVLGLIDAIEKFDPARDIKFETYAEFRIRGAILDELRNLDWAPRAVRHKIHQLQAAIERLEGAHKRHATDEELAAELCISLEEYFDLLNMASGVTLMSLEDLGYSKDSTQRRNVLEYYREPHNESLIELLHLRETRDIIAAVLESLPDNERFVLSMYYFDELTMKEIGLVLGITESRVSQIHNKAILRLKARLRQRLHGNPQELL